MEPSLRLPQLRPAPSAKTRTAASANATAASAPSEAAALDALRPHTAAATAFSVPFRLGGAAPHSPHRAPAVAVAVAATVPAPRPSAVLQSKLRRAVWLDQLTSFAHAEARERARMRCAEAEQRDAAWWQHLRRRATIHNDGEHAWREAAAAAVSCVPSPARSVAHAALFSSEACGRRTIAAEAQVAREVLHAVHYTAELHDGVRHLRQAQEDGAAMQHAAEQVRALELRLGELSYRTVPAFAPAVDDLFAIADGHRPGSVRSPPRPLPRLRSAAPPTPAVLPEAPCEAKIAEMYVRRHLVLDEAMERLLLEWWAGAAQVRWVEEPAARQPLAQCAVYVRSRGCMHAVVSLQRWWRVLRLAPWSQHRRSSLTHALAALPGHHTSARLNLHLRLLERGVQQGGTASQLGSDVAELGSGHSAALAALVAAAMHPRRYRAMMQLYTYTAVQRARAMLARAPASEAAHIDPSLLLPHTFNHFPPPYDAWRARRWPAHPLQRLHGMAAARQEERGAGAPTAAVDVLAQQAALAQTERAARRRIVQQAAYECAAWQAAALAGSLPPGVSEQQQAVQQSRGVSAGGSALDAVPAERLADQAADAAPAPSNAHAPGPQAAVADCEWGWHLAQAALISAQMRCAAPVREEAPWLAEQEAPVTSAADKAAWDFRDTFDMAAAAVYGDEYATVRVRYIARSAAALEEMRTAFKATLRQRAALVAEEAEERQRLCGGQPRAQLLRRFELAHAESQARAALEAAHARATEHLVDARRADTEMAQWAAAAMALDVAAAPPPPRRALHALPSMTPADRLLSREALRRECIERDRVTALSDVLASCHAAYGALRFSIFSTLLRTEVPQCDRIRPANPPVAQLCVVRAEERDRRQALWCESQAALRAVVLDMPRRYAAETAWPDFLFGHLKLTSEAAYMDAQLRTALYERLGHVWAKTEELVAMECMARSRVAYAEAITRDLRFHLNRLRLE